MNLQYQIIGEFRRKLQKSWIVLGSIIILMLLLQTILGKYNGMIVDIWMWALLLVFPAWILLVLSGWWNKFPARLITKTASLSFTWLNIGYLVMLLLTIFLSQAAINQGEWSLQQYFQKSFLWLTPFNILLIIGMVILLYRKEMRKRPNAAIIESVAKERAQIAAKNKYIIEQQCLELMAQGELKQALNLLQEHSDQGSRNQVIMLRSQHTALVRELDLNLIDVEEGQIRLNKLTMAILNMSEELR